MILVCVEGWIFASWKKRH